MKMRYLLQALALQIVFVLLVLKPLARHVKGFAF